jgi:hypothetical protein
MQEAMPDEAELPLRTCTQVRSTIESDFHHVDSLVSVRQVRKDLFLDRPGDDVMDTEFSAVGSGMRWMKKTRIDQDQSCRIHEITMYQSCLNHV